MLAQRRPLLFMFQFVKSEDTRKFRLCVYFSVLYFYKVSRLIWYENWKRSSVVKQ